MISLIVPVFNMKQYLPRCMERLLVQVGTYEIILVDDGSQDGTALLCDQYAEKYPDFVYVVHKENGGLSSARNTGMDVAHGEYVTFPDPDDWVEPEFVERMLALQEQYQPELLSFGYNVEYETNSKSIHANRGLTFQRMNRIEAQKSLVLPSSMGGFAWNKLYHLDIIRDNGLRFLDDVGITEDLDFSFRYLQYCKNVIFSPEDSLYHYYQHRGAATHSSFSSRQMESIRTYEKMIAMSTDKELILIVEEEICNTVINLILSYQNSQIQDAEIWKNLRYYLRRYLKTYCKSNRYGRNRKIQALLAYYAPKLYAVLKNQVSRKM